MLYKEAIESAIPLATKLNANGFMLDVNGDNPLTAIVDGTTVVVEEVRDDELGIDAVRVNAAASIEQTNDEKNVVHDTFFDDLVELGSTVISEQIKFAREVVLPVVIQYMGNVENAVNDSTSNELNKFQIVEYSLVEPFKSDSFLHEVLRYTDSPYTEYNFNLKFPELTDDELMDKFTFGAEVVDIQVKNFIDRIGIEVIQDVYNTVFRGIESEIYSNDLNFRQLMMNHEEVPTIVFLLSSILIDNPFDGITLNLNEYNSILTDLRNSSGKILADTYSQYNAAIKRGIVIKAVVNNEHVVVYPETYAQFIDNGNSAETVLGSLFTDSPYVTISQLQDHATELNNLWEHNVSMMKKVAYNNRFSKARDILKDQFLAIVRENSDLVSDENLTFKIFNEELELINNDELNDVCTVAQKLLCRSIFYNSEAEVILSSMIKKSNDNDSLDVREVALLSTIDLIIDWLCSLTKITEEFNQDETY